MTERTRASIDAALQLLVDDLIASFDSVEGTWKPCWSTGRLFPHNAVTGIDYRGINTLMLWAAQIKNEYHSPRWATFRMWQSIGGQVRKGEHSTWGVKWVDIVDKKDPDNLRRVPKVFHLFNAAQVEGTDELGEAASVPSNHWFQHFEDFRTAVPYRWVVGTPMYVPSRDVVSMPPMEQFDTPEEWAQTLCHELGHWTGHESRLDRKPQSRHAGIQAYAFEELVAEISASMTCAWLQIPGEIFREDHVRYVRSWLKSLKDDPGILFSAALAAQRATDHLVAYSQPKEAPCPTDTATLSASFL